MPGGKKNNVDGLENAGIYLCQCAGRGGAQGARAPPSSPIITWDMATLFYSGQLASHLQLVPI